MLLRLKDFLFVGRIFFAGGRIVTWITEDDGIFSDVYQFDFDCRARMYSVEKYECWCLIWFCHSSKYNQQSNTCDRFLQNEEIHGVQRFLAHRCEAPRFHLISFRTKKVNYDIFIFSRCAWQVRLRRFYYLLCISICQFHILLPSLKFFDTFSTYDSLVSVPISKKS